MNFPSPLLKGTLVKRYRRILADVRLDDGTEVTAHVFSPGSMAGCCEPGRPVLLSDSKDRMRKHPLTWELIDMHGNWVGVNPTVSRQVFVESVTGGSLSGFSGYTIENGSGGARTTEIILQSLDNLCAVSLQGVSWAEKGRAFFPDSPSLPARRSLQKLCEMKARGHRAIALFHVLRSDCDVLHPAESVDGAYADMVREAINAGVEFQAFRGDVTPSGITLGSGIPFVPE